MQQTKNLRYCLAWIEVMIYRVCRNRCRGNVQRKFFLCDTRSWHITVDGDVRDADKQQKKEVNVSFVLKLLLKFNNSALCNLYLTP